MRFPLEVFGKALAITIFWYYDQVKRAVENMVRDRLLLCEDADAQLERLVQVGLDAGVPASNGELPDSELRHCKPHKSNAGKK